LACSGVAGAFTVAQWDVALTEEATWPEFDEDMPLTLRVESFFEDGLSDAFIDNTDAIGAWLEDWNESRAWPPEPEAPEEEPPLVFDGETDPSLTEEPEPSSTETAEPDAGITNRRNEKPAKTSADDSTNEGAGGCACRFTPDSRRGDGFGAALLGLLFLWRRRMRA
jgi:MYXO-CTERM domain-containing protein